MKIENKRKLLSMLDQNILIQIGCLCMLFVFIIGVVGEASANKVDERIIAHWPFNEGSGNLTYDQSPEHFKALFRHSRWVNDGTCNEGSCLFFNGTSSSLKVKDKINIVGDKMTLSAWIRSDDFCRDVANNCEGSIISKAQRSGNQLYTWMIGTYKEGDEARLRFMLRTGGVTHTLISNARGILTTNQWNHVAATYDGKYMRVYVNGEEVGNRRHRGDISHNPSPFRIGRNSSGSAPYFGYIDDVRIYEAALHRSEIKNLHNCLNTSCSVETDLITVNFNEVSLRDAPLINNGYYNMHVREDGSTTYSSNPNPFIEVKIELTETPLEAGTIEYDTTGSTAVLGKHYNIIEGISPIQFNTDQRTVIIKVQLLNDSKWFKEKFLDFRLKNSSGTTPGEHPKFRIGIRPDVEEPPVLQITNSNTQRVGLGQYDVHFNIDAISKEDTNIHYEVISSNKTSFSEGVDWIATKSGKSKIPAGRSSTQDAGGIPLQVTILTPGHTGETLSIKLKHERNTREDENEFVQTKTHDFEFLDPDFAAFPSVHFADGGLGFDEDGYHASEVVEQTNLGVLPENVKYTYDENNPYPIQAVIQTEGMTSNYYSRESFATTYYTAGPDLLLPLKNYSLNQENIDTWPEPFDGPANAQNSKNVRYISMTARTRSQSIQHMVVFDRESEGVDWEGKPVPTVTTATGTWGVWRLSEVHPIHQVWNRDIGVREVVINGKLVTQVWYEHRAEPWKDEAAENTSGTSVHTERLNLITSKIKVGDYLKNVESGEITKITSIVDSRNIITQDDLNLSSGDPFEVLIRYKNTNQQYKYEQVDDDQMNCIDRFTHFNNFDGTSQNTGGVAGNVGAGPLVYGKYFRRYEVPHGPIDFPWPKYGLWWAPRGSATIDPRLENTYVFIME